MAPLTPFLRTSTSFCPSAVSQPAFLSPVRMSSALRIALHLATLALQSATVCVPAALARSPDVHFFLITVDEKGVACFVQPSADVSTSFFCAVPRACAQCVALFVGVAEQVGHA
jgi:hypothetical protein